MKSIHHTPLYDRLLIDIHHAYLHRIVLTGKEPAFWILISFLITFGLIRAVTYSIYVGKGPFNDITVRGRHIHHLVPGIFLLLISGYISLALPVGYFRDVLAAAFGVGAALTLDEFALWLKLKDVYWQKEGRISIDIIIVVATIASLVVIGADFWKDAGRIIYRLLL